MDANDSRGFYLVLPSNVQPDFHPTNTASRYQTTFPSSYDLPGEWEVALYEISYVNTIPTIVNETFSINSSKLESDKKVYELSVAKFTLPREGIDLPDDPLERAKTILQTGIPYNTFTPRQSDCPFTITFNKETHRIEIKALEDLEPHFYMFFAEAAKMKLTNPNGRELENGKYRQLWTETLKRGDTFIGSGEAQVLIGAEKITLYESKKECLTITVSKGYYPTMKKLVEALNQETKHPLANWETSEESGGTKACGYKFGYNPGENRLVLGLVQHTDLTFNDDLNSILGFKEKKYSGRRQTAEYPPLMNRGIYHLYIYCDLCSPIRVGDSLVPLLRPIEIPSSSDWGKVTSLRFNRPMYTPVNKSTFNSVLIHLYDDTGKPITFSEGRTVVTLHLRPRL